MDDDELRRRQREAEACGDRARNQMERRQIFIEHSERIRIFQEVQMEIALAMRLIRDNVEHTAIIDALIALRRSDPRACILESDVALAASTIALAEMRLGRGGFIGGL